MTSRRSARAFFRDADGNSTMEFVVVFPLLIYFFCLLGEMGLLMARNVTLERALDIAVRDVRLGSSAVDTHDGLKDRICQSAFLLGDCDEVLLLELTSLGASLSSIGSLPGGTVNCRNRADKDIDPVIKFDASGPGEIVMIRACMVVDPLFPGAGILAQLPTDVGGGYAVISSAAFINEPG